MVWERETGRNCQSRRTSNELRSTQCCDLARKAEVDDILAAVMLRFRYSNSGHPGDAAAVGV